MSGTLTVAKQLTRSAVRIASDALRPGAALPLSEWRVADAVFMQNLLRQHGIGAYREIGSIRSVHVLDTQSISSNCNNRVLALEYDEDHATWPRSMFLKMPVRSLATRLFMGTIMSWELECDFYRNVAPLLPVRVPRAYAMLNRSSRMLMLMENLHDDPGIVLHSNPEMLTGLSLESARRGLRTMARFHASFHGISRDEQQRLLPDSKQPFTSPVMRALSPLMGRAALRQCRKREDLVLSDEHVAWFHKATAHWDALVDWWTDGDLTLLHGDSHMGNHFFYGEEGGMLDWQAAQWGKGIRDVQYFLTDSLPAELLAQHEDALVRYYLEQLAGAGVQLNFEETWYQYRGFSFQTWMTIVVSIGLGAMTGDMDEVMPEIHRRCIASIDRLRLGEWLDEVLADE